jgi:sporulation protein YlmC with PRC-barrel domain
MKTALGKTMLPAAWLAASSMLLPLAPLAAPFAGIAGTGAAAPDSGVYVAVRYASARNLLGQPVVDSTGKPVGKIRDLLVRLDTGSARYSELSVDAGGTEWLPVHELHSRAAQTGFTLGMTASRLAERSSSAGSGVPFSDGSLRASQLLGQRVTDRNGKNIGALHDIVVDMQRGQVEHAVVRFDSGVLAKNELSTFSLDLLSARRVADRLENLMLDVDAAQLRERIGYSMREWEGVYDPARWLRPHSPAR